MKYANIFKYIVIPKICIYMHSKLFCVFSAKQIVELLLLKNKNKMHTNLDLSIIIINICKKYEIKKINII